jgi:hypothetical protein
VKHNHAAAAVRMNPRGISAGGPVMVDSYK